MCNKIIGILMMLVLIILGYLYNTFNYIKAKNILRITMVLILLIGINLLFKE